MRPARPDDCRGLNKRPASSAFAGEAGFYYRRDSRFGLDIEKRGMRLVNVDTNKEAAKWQLLLVRQIFLLVLLRSPIQPLH